MSSCFDSSLSFHTYPKVWRGSGVQYVAIVAETTRVSQIEPTQQSCFNGPADRMWK